MINIADILQQRLQAYKDNPLEAEKKRGKEYQKCWNDGVQYFQLWINKDRKKEGKPPITFMAVKMKLLALKEIDDLRWFYRECIKYSNTYQKLLVNGKPVRNSFSRCFYGALKIK
jgi:hypothetical protein